MCWFLRGGAAAATTYTVTDLGVLPGGNTSQAFKINSSGDIAGASNETGNLGGYRPVIWTNGVVRALPLPAGTSATISSGPVAINNATPLQVIGAISSANANDGAVRWDGLVPTPLYSANGGHANAYAINDNGVVAGLSTEGLTVWHGNVATTVPNNPPEVVWSRVTGINNNGIIAGTATVAGRLISAVISNGIASSVLGQLPGSINGPGMFGTGINNAGVVVGFDANAQGTRTAVKWIGGVATPLPHLAGYNDSAPTDINQAGDIVGTARDAITFGGPFRPGRLPDRPVVWKDGVPIDLIANSDAVAKGIALLSVNGINDAGQIVGVGTVGGQVRAILLTPNNKVTMLDPVPLGPSDSLIESVALSGTPRFKEAEYLATKGREVKGIAADGVAQIVIRIPANSMNDITVRVKEDTRCLDGNSDSYGRIYDAFAPPSDIFQSTPTGDLTLRPVATSKGPMAFAVYRAPADFVRSDCPSNATTDTGRAQRSVTLQFGAGIADLEVTIVRPPVMVVHGMWATSDNLGDLIQLASLGVIDLKVKLVNYGLNVFLLSGIPDGRSNFFVPGSALGFAYGAEVTLDQTRQQLDYFRQGLAPIPVAAVRADFVAHSMGNLVTRTMPTIANYYNMANYKKGHVHKLISIGGPHLGSPFGVEAVRSENSCVRDVMASDLVSSYIFDDCRTCVQAKGTQTSTNSYVGGGAVGDLKANLDGSGASLGITRLSGIPSVPTTYIVGFMSSDQIRSFIDPNPSIPPTCDDLGRCNDGVPLTGLELVYAGCRDTSPPTPFLRHFQTPESFIAFMGSQNDGVVPLESALNGRPTSHQTVIPGVLHSPGTAMLYSIRKPPTLLTPGPGPSGISLIVEKVQVLLNTPVTDTDVYLH